MHKAAIHGRKEIVALLLKSGAVVDAKENWGRTPLLSFAATGGTDNEIARMLLAAGADPGLEVDKSDDGYVALQWAAETGNIGLAEMLIAARVDVNHQNTWGWTPLHQAVLNVHADIARLLIANGADVNLRNNLGNTPLFYAANDAKLKQMLVNAGAK